MISLVPFPWIMSALCLIDMLILSCMFLLNLPISGLVVLIRHHLVFVVKFFLCSLTVMNTGLGLVFGR